LEIGNDPEIINLGRRQQVAKVCIALIGLTKCQGEKGNGYPVAQCCSLGQDAEIVEKLFSTKGQKECH